MEEIRQGGAGGPWTPEQEWAAKRLWDFYVDRLRGLARKRLSKAARLGGDQDDLVASVFGRLCRGLKEGKLADLSDRVGLRRLLAHMTVKGAARRHRDATRLKRGGPSGGREHAVVLEELAAADLTPSEVAAKQEEYERLLDVLHDASLRAIVDMGMRGFSNVDIAAQLAVSVSTVERKRRRIRKTWAAAYSELVWPEEKNENSAPV